MISIRQYQFSSQDFDEWNEFVAQSKNGTFLIDRRYMDYHCSTLKKSWLLYCQHIAMTIHCTVIVD